MKRRNFIFLGAQGGKTMPHKSSIGAIALVALICDIARNADSSRRSGTALQGIRRTSVGRAGLN
jgi:hypothetical protein